MTWWDAISEREKEIDALNAVKQQKWKLSDEREQKEGRNEGKKENTF